MASLTIKGIPEDVLERLRRRAQENRRSLNSEVLYVIEISVGRRPAEPEDLLERIRRRRERLNITDLTPEMIREARREGRE